MEIVIIGLVVCIIGLVLTADKLRRCEHCREIIRSDAKVCKHCGRDVKPAVDKMG